MTVSKHGKYLGVVAFANDGHYLCVECASVVYGVEAVEAVINGIPGTFEHYTDTEGNPLNPVLWGSEELHGTHCEALCLELLTMGLKTEKDTRLCYDDCECYAGEIDNCDYDPMRTYSNYLVAFGNDRYHTFVEGFWCHSYSYDAAPTLARDILGFSKMPLSYAVYAGHTLIGYHQVEGV